MATAASCGSHPLIDLSGPGAGIASDQSGAVHLLHRAGKGRVRPQQHRRPDLRELSREWFGIAATGSGIHGGTPLGVGNDICVSNIGAAANTIRQFSLDRDDYGGAFTRTLVSATSRLRMVTGFENNRLLPDNSWLLFRAEWLNYSRQEMWMAKDAAVSRAGFD